MDDEAKDERVRRFCEMIFMDLDREDWGAVEPEVFRNIAEGADEDGKDYYANKMSQDEMAEAVTSMKRILVRALDALDEEG